MCIPFFLTDGFHKNRRHFFPCLLFRRERIHGLDAALESVQKQLSDAHDGAYRERRLQKETTEAVKVKTGKKNIFPRAFWNNFYGILGQSFAITLTYDGSFLDRFNENADLPRKQKNTQHHTRHFKVALEKERRHRQQLEADRSQLTDLYEKVREYCDLEEKTRNAPPAFIFLPLFSFSGPHFAAHV